MNIHSLSTKNDKRKSVVQARKNARNNVSKNQSTSCKVTPHLPNTKKKMKFCQQIPSLSIRSSVTFHWEKKEYEFYNKT